MQLIEGDTAALDLLQDVIGRSGPDKRLGIFVVNCDVFLNRLDQISYAVKHTPAKIFVGEVSKESFDHVEP